MEKTEERLIEIISFKEQRKMIFKISNICVTGVLEMEETDNGTEKNIGEIVTEIFPKMMKDSHYLLRPSQAIFEKLKPLFPSIFHNLLSALFFLISLISI